MKDLYSHTWLVTSWQQSQSQYQFLTNKTSVESFTVPQNIRANTLPVTVKLIEEGLGIGMLPDIFLKESLKKEKLIKLLPKISCKKWPIHAVHPYHGKVPKKYNTL